MRIEDGLGSGRMMQVNDENRGMTQSIVESEIGHESIHSGKAFIMATPLLTVTTTGGIVWWFYNGSTDESFIIDQIVGSWNGDSTNRNRCCFTTLYAGATTPSANHTAGTIRNLNTNSAITASGSLYYYWNETGDGMTVSSSGALVGNVILGQGVKDLQFHGGTVIAPGVTLAVNAKAESAAGEFAVIVSGYFKAGE